MKAPNRLQPSTIAASSISTGCALKNPISSQEQNGMVKVGYTSTSDHIEFCNPSSAMIRDSGRKRSVGGNREGGKKRMASVSPLRLLMRGGGQPGGGGLCRGVKGPQDPEAREI